MSKPHVRRTLGVGQLDTKKSIVENDVLLKRKSHPQKREADYGLTSKPIHMAIIDHVTESFGHGLGITGDLQRWHARAGAHHRDRKAGA